MKVAYIQTSPFLGEVRRNLEEAWSLIERVRDADLVVLPELFYSGYIVRSKDEAKSLAVSPDTQSEPLNMCLDAARSFNMTLVGGFPELDEKNNRLYNSAWMITASGVLAVYRKVHLFDREWDLFIPGDDEGPISKVSFGKPGGGPGSSRVGMQLCFDWVFPENWGKLAWGSGEGTGAQIIAHPVNLVIPDKCPLALRTRAMENRIFIISAGRVGTDPGPSGDLEFKAGSRIISPDGEILSAGPDDKPGCDLVTINPELADDKFLTPKDNVLMERFNNSRPEQESGKQ